MEKVIELVSPQGMKELKIDTEKFVELYNAGKAELLDVRMPFEIEVWSVNFGLKIPAPELPKNLDKLPRDKIIVCACPGKERSSIAMCYLRSKNFNAVYLEDGLLGLMTKLKGGKAKKIKLKK